MLPPKFATLGWGRGFPDTYGQNVTISPSVVFEPAGPPVGSRDHSSLGVIVMGLASI